MYIMQTVQSHVELYDTPISVLAVLSELSITQQFGNLRLEEEIAELLVTTAVW